MSDAVWNCSGAVWRCLRLFWAVWGCLGAVWGCSGIVCGCLGLFGAVLVLSGLSGAVWGCLGLFGVVWGCLGLFWGCLVLFWAVWGLSNPVCFFPVRAKAQGSLCPVLPPYGGRLREGRLILRSFTCHWRVGCIIYRIFTCVPYGPRMFVRIFTYRLSNLIILVGSVVQKLSTLSHFLAMRFKSCRPYRTSLLRGLLLGPFPKGPP